MTERERSQSVVSERAVLVGVILPENAERFDDLNELEGLVEAARSVPVAKLSQKREQPDNASYIGKGKVEELRLLAESTKADLIVFDNDLSPAQTRTLEKSTNDLVEKKIEEVRIKHEKALQNDLKNLFGFCDHSRGVLTTFPASKSPHVEAFTNKLSALFR